MFLTAPQQIKEAGRSDAEILALLDGGGGGGRTSSGVIVTEKNAMRQATVWACVKIISEVIAQLPIGVQQREGDSWIAAPDHKALSLLNAPNDWQTAHEFVSHLFTWSELRGNAYALKVRDGTGAVVRLMPVPADSVTVKQLPDWSLAYVVRPEGTGVAGTFPASEIFHFRNFGTNSVVGMSTIGQLRESIGLALRTEQHGSKLFQHGASIGKVISAPSATPEQITLLQNQLAEKYEGAQNSFKTMILQGDMKVDTVAMSNSDAQYLEVRQYQKQEIASAFGVPLFILNDTAKATTWGTGLEQQLRAFLTISLQPRLCRAAQTFARELLPPAERMRTRFVWDTDMLARGDFKDRMVGYKTGIEAGVLNPNESREREGLNPRDGGEDYRQPLNIGTEGDDTDDDDDTPPGNQQELFDDE